MSANGKKGTVQFKGRTTETYPLHIRKHEIHATRVLKSADQWQDEGVLAYTQQLDLVAKSKNLACRCNFTFLVHLQRVHLLLKNMSHQLSKL